MTAGAARRLAWSLWALAAGLTVAGIVFSVLTRDTEVAGRSGLFTGSLLALANLAFPTVGALVASRRPGNPIGWIFLSAGVPVALLVLAEGYGVHALYTDPGGLPGGEVMAWLGVWAFILPLFATPALLFLLFPDGRLPSRRWRPVAWLSVVAPAVAAFGAAVSPGPLEDAPFGEVINPFGVEGAEALWLAPTFGWLGSAAAVVAAATCMVRRLRRARGLERRQLMWIATAAAFFGLACFVGITTYFAGYEDVSLVMFLAFPAIPITAGYAILRHQLYDVAVVINRALVYGGLTALLGGIYLGSVLLAGLAVGESDLAIAVSTLAVAALFRPARARIQALVDRRFYRRRYDAALTLEAFGGRLRDELDLEALGGDLRAVVAETVQPAHVSLWLRSAR